MTNLNEILDQVVSALGAAEPDNTYSIRVSNGKFWIEHDEVGSGEPFRQFLQREIENATTTPMIPHEYPTKDEKKSIELAESCLAKLNEPPVNAEDALYELAAAIRIFATGERSNQEGRKNIIFLFQRCKKEIVKLIQELNRRRHLSSLF